MAGLALRRDLGRHAYRGTGRDEDVGRLPARIDEVPAYVTGPASRACGGCHRAELINEDEAGELVIFNQHTKQGGYLVEAAEDETSTLGTVIDEIMAIFK